MAMNASSVSVTAGAPGTLIVAGGGTYSDKRSVIVYNPGATTVYLGGSGVTSAAGFHVAAGQSVALDLLTGDDLYGITASGSQSVNVLRSRS